MHSFTIVEAASTTSALEKTLAEGLCPAPYELVYRLMDSKKIRDACYLTGTVLYRGEIRDATPRDIGRFDEMRHEGWGFLFVNYHCWYPSRTLWDLNGAVVGMRPETIAAWKDGTLRLDELVQK